MTYKRVQGKLFMMAKASDKDLQTKTQLGTLQLSGVGYLRELLRRMVDFEQKYHMTSEAFIERFERGELGDSHDFMDWAGCCEQYHDLEQRLETLLRAAGI